MTREEAIKMLKSKMDGHTDTSYEWAETVRMAIKALDREPCEDAISRQAAIDAFQMFREYYSNRSNKEWVDRIETVLNQLSPVNPTKTGHWIVHEKPHGIRYLECPYCNIWYLNEHLIRNSYCPNCGAKMIESQEDISTKGTRCSQDRSGVYQKRYED